MIGYLTAGLYFTWLDCFLVCMSCCAKVLSADVGESGLESSLIKSSSKNLPWWELFLPNCRTRKWYFQIQFPSSQDNTEELQPVSMNSEVP